MGKPNASSKLFVVSLLVTCFLTDPGLGLNVCEAERLLAADRTFALSRPYLYNLKILGNAECPVFDLRSPGRQFFLDSNYEVDGFQFNMNRHSLAVWNDPVLDLLDVPEESTMSTMSLSARLNPNASIPAFALNISCSRADHPSFSMQSDCPFTLEDLEPPALEGHHFRPLILAFEWVRPLPPLNARGLFLFADVLAVDEEASSALTCYANLRVQTLSGSQAFTMVQISDNISSNAYFNIDGGGRPVLLHRIRLAFTLPMTRGNISIDVRQLTCRDLSNGSETRSNLQGITIAASTLPSSGFGITQVGAYLQRLDDGHVWARIHAADEGAGVRTCRVNFFYQDHSVNPPSSGPAHEADMHILSPATDNIWGKMMYRSGTWINWTGVHLQSIICYNGNDHPVLVSVRQTWIFNESFVDMAPPVINGAQLPASPVARFGESTLISLDINVTDDTSGIANCTALLLSNDAQCDSPHCSVRPTGHHVSGDIWSLHFKVETQLIGMGMLVQDITCWDLAGNQAVWTEPVSVMFSAVVTPAPSYLTDFHIAEPILTITNNKAAVSVQSGPIVRFDVDDFLPQRIAGTDTNFFREIYTSVVQLDRFPPIIRGVNVSVAVNSNLRITAHWLVDDDVTNQSLDCNMEFQLRDNPSVMLNLTESLEPGELVTRSSYFNASVLPGGEYDLRQIECIDEAGHRAQISGLADSTTRLNISTTIFLDAKAPEIYGAWFESAAVTIESGTVTNILLTVNVTDLSPVSCLAELRNPHDVDSLVQLTDEPTLSRPITRTLAIKISTGRGYYHLRQIICTDAFGLISDVPVSASLMQLTLGFANPYPLANWTGLGQLVNSSSANVTAEFGATSLDPSLLNCTILLEDDLAQIHALEAPVLGSTLHFSLHFPRWSSRQNFTFKEARCRDSFNYTMVATPENSFGLAGLGQVAVQQVDVGDVLAPEVLQVRLHPTELRVAATSAGIIPAVYSVDIAVDLADLSGVENCSVGWQLAPSEHGMARREQTAMDMAHAGHSHGDDELNSGPPGATHYYSHVSSPSAVYQLPGRQKGRLPNSTYSHVEPASSPDRPAGYGRLDGSHTTYATTAINGSVVAPDSGLANDRGYFVLDDPPPPTLPPSRPRRRVHLEPSDTSENSV
ncbi:uncharacterized protein MONBRDRAFT_9018 [Monosiga brevicollis MX1]|uniref:Cadherin domain-containing protein n=1 Tax=Monosiga brevicollis TaxID=81824 RepID=A9V1U4_MONBE|nr:uncharacterized protein MONBRDRAFT_9018 [Monosiga brevicollis MX1]EDQ88504.1 predicted protein [Monosiga brevicollis MX1]|eukprot:XP_001746608.1 hypothetical protein [Monosiga brevicollis MX1]